MYVPVEATRALLSAHGSLGVQLRRPETEKEGVGGATTMARGFRLFVHKMVCVSVCVSV